MHRETSAPQYGIDFGDFGDKAGMIKFLQLTTYEGMSDEAAIALVKQSLVAPGPGLVRAELTVAQQVDADIQAAMQRLRAPMPMMYTPRMGQSPVVP